MSLSEDNAPQFELVTDPDPGVPPTVEDAEAQADSLANAQTNAQANTREDREKQDD
jgi:hypothetical protein